MDDQKPKKATTRFPSTWAELKASYPELDFMPDEKWLQWARERGVDPSLRPADHDAHRPHRPEIHYKEQFTKKDAKDLADLQAKGFKRNANDQKIMIDLINKKRRTDEVKRRDKEEKEKKKNKSAEVVKTPQERIAELEGVLGARRTAKENLELEALKKQVAQPAPSVQTKPEPITEAPKVEEVEKVEKVENIEAEAPTKSTLNVVPQESKSEIPETRIQKKKTIKEIYEEMRQTRQEEKENKVRPEDKEEHADEGLYGHEEKAEPQAQDQTQQQSEQPQIPQQQSGPSSAVRFGERQAIRRIPAVRNVERKITGRLGGGAVKMANRAAKGAKALMEGLRAAFHIAQGVLQLVSLGWTLGIVFIVIFIMVFVIALLGGIGGGVTTPGGPGSPGGPGGIAGGGSPFPSVAPGPVQTVDMKTALDSCITQAGGNIKDYHSYLDLTDQQRECIANILIALGYDRSLLSTQAFIDEVNRNLSSSSTTELTLAAEQLIGAYRVCDPDGYAGYHGVTYVSQTRSSCMRAQLSALGYSGDKLDIASNMDIFSDSDEGTRACAQCTEFVVQSLILAYGGADSKAFKPNCTYGCVPFNGNSPVTQNWATWDNNNHIYVRVPARQPPQAGDIASTNDDPDISGEATAFGHVLIVKDVRLSNNTFTGLESNWSGVPGYPRLPQCYVSDTVDYHPIKFYSYWRLQ